MTEFLQLRDLDKRREAILKSMKDLGKLTPELEKKVNEAETISLLEDIHLLRLRPPNWYTSNIILAAIRKCLSLFFQVIRDISNRTAMHAMKPYQ